MAQPEESTRAIGITYVYQTPLYTFPDGALGTEYDFLSELSRRVPGTDYSHSSYLGPPVVHHLVKLAAWIYGDPTNDGHPYRMLLRAGLELATLAPSGGFGAMGRIAATGLRAEVRAGALVSRAATVRNLVAEEVGESGLEIFIHGTTAEAAAKFELAAGRRFFTAVDPETARMFALRSVAKAGGGEPGGVILALPQNVVKQLRSGGRPLLLVKPIDDMPHLLEWIFEPGAYETITTQGWILELPPGVF